MRHRKNSQKFSRSRAQRKALKKSLLRSLIIYERIKTSEAKAKELSSWIDRLISLAKEPTLANKRLAYKVLCDHMLVKKLFDNIAPRFKGINGGYSRIFGLGYRKGDASKISLIELTRVEKKEKKIIQKKEKEQKNVEVERKEERHAPLKEKPKKTIIDGVKGIFKKERDSL
ncbi:MAG: 50S ribosomal protein L17 [Candidatus Omnitrophica bacterium]|jgi:large subunit ribosomal protein L17|nr:50S ribosomal protein L17 [Candidatus Omnitrophota bacterium]